jgi:hypothetical protein
MDKGAGLDVLKPAADNALLSEKPAQWIFQLVSKRANRSRASDDDRTLIEKISLVSHAS